ncbi:olfactory receptor 6N1-like [Protopterus annectens]|uniref:olfactory receptor 6N1-like n=1 Tax=Protopterus annectens TaxID=7888 RepID=UPI001CFA2E5E|nr:olfactory receptor 6N1-like [Protopterus annectens]
MTEPNKTDFNFQEFFLTGFQNMWDKTSKIKLCTIFLLIYIITILGNGVLVILVKLNQSLHTPMYYFICNLAFLDICIPSVTVPKIASYLLFGDRSIKFGMCLTQMMFYIGLWTAESFSLTVMSYDRYQAICNPLMYPLVMSNKKSIRLSVCCWIGGMTTGIIVLLFVLTIPMCSANKLNHSFCDFFVLVQLACTDAELSAAAGFIGTSCLSLSLFFIMLSYIKILLSLQKMTSSKGHKKAFSTCATHLLVVIMFYLLTLFAMICNKTPACSGDTWIMAATLQTMLPPMINPFIYSFRTKEIQDCVREIHQSWI